MRNRLSRLTFVLAIAAIMLMAGRSWAIFDQLPGSEDEWKLKYDVEVNPAAGGKVAVLFTLADEGRLKPVYSATVIALSKQTDSQGGHSYDVKAPLELKATDDGQRAGQVLIPKDLADRAMIRVLTLTLDGKRRPNAAYIDIPLKKYLNKTTTAASPQDAPAKVRK